MQLQKWGKQHAGFARAAAEYAKVKDAAAHIPALEQSLKDTLGQQVPVGPSGAVMVGVKADL